MSSVPQPLNYKDLDLVLLDAFPELRERYEKEFDYWGKESTDRPGSYIAFGLVVYPFMIEKLDSPQGDEPLSRLSGFLERMAVSVDAEVVNLLGLEVIDKLVYDKAHLHKSWKHLGPATKQYTRQAAAALNLERNLPRR